MEWIVDGLLYAAAVSTGLVAGLFFAFSTFIMTSLEETPHPGGMAAMQAINRVILQSLFMPLFFGSTLIALVLAGLAVLNGDGASAGLTVVAAALYVLGMFGVTAAFNVPLNNRLDQSALDTEDGAALWRHYLRVWTRWNHVRTLASALSCLLFTIVIGLG